MAFFSNAAVNRLALHFTLHQLAWSISGIFFAVFLIRAGFSPAGVFLVLAAMLVVRLALRPLVLAVVAAIGLRKTLILGTVLSVPQILSLAAVHGAVDIELITYILATGVGDVFYWTCYHAAFAQLGDAKNRGAQVSARGLLSTLAGVAGPVIGGGMLAVASPWAAFGVGAVIALASVLPLLKIAEVPIVTTAAGHSFKAVRAGVILFSTDGFITCCSWVTWDIISFASLDQRYDAFGGLLGAAALAGAIGGMVLGRLIDAGHSRRAVWLNAAVIGALLILKALCGGSPTGVVVSTLVATALAGIYLPTLMTAIYNEAKASPCAFRFHFVAEGGWDVGGTAACLIAAAAWEVGVPLRIILLFGLAGVVVQGVLLRRRYDAHASAAPLATVTKSAPAGA
ncbi:MAG: MFS transporter [Xanthobacteraceae bacterium]